MPFKVRELNHSPKWYYEHCRCEDGGSAAFRSMLNADMRFLEAADDLRASYAERIPIYEAAWNAALSRGADGQNVVAIQGVLEREGQLGFRAENEYKLEPFRTIGRLIAKHNLSENDVVQFLKWCRKNPPQPPTPKTKKVENKWSEYKRKVSEGF